MVGNSELRISKQGEFIMETDNEIFKELDEISYYELLESKAERENSKNLQFIRNCKLGFKPKKVYKNGQIPYELSDKYMEEHK